MFSLRFLLPYMIQISWELLFLVVLRFTHAGLNKIQSLGVVAQWGEKLYFFLKQQQQQQNIYVSLSEVVAFNFSVFMWLCNGTEFEGWRRINVKNSPLVLCSLVTKQTSVKRGEENAPWMSPCALTPFPPWLLQVLHRAVTWQAVVAAPVSGASRTSPLLATTSPFTNKSMDGSSSSYPALRSSFNDAFPLLFL